METIRLFNLTNLLLFIATALVCSKLLCLLEKRVNNIHKACVSDFVTRREKLLLEREQRNQHFNQELKKRMRDLDINAIEKIAFEKANLNNLFKRKEKELKEQFAVLKKRNDYVIETKLLKIKKLTLN